MFDEIFTGAGVTIDAARCLNTRHDRARCRSCIEACPTSAISLHSHLPELDAERCVRCGACTPVCPTDAVVDDDAPERRLLETCAAIDTSAITLACAVNPHPSAVEPTDAVVRHGRCLAALNPTQLIALSRGGTRRIGLDLGWCAECTISTAANVVVAVAEASNALATIVSGSTTPIVRLGGLDPGDAGTAVGAVVDSRRPPMSRRGMFANLRRRAEAAVERSAEPLPPPARRTRGPVLERLPHSVPTSRKRLLDVLRDLAGASASTTGSVAPISDNGLPFTEITVDRDRCSGCELCARYCPTGALDYVTADSDSGRTLTLTFRADICIDCNICTVACPEEAVSSGGAITADRLVRPTRSVLAAAPLVPCMVCGIPTAALEDAAAARCFSCRLGTGMVTALRDDAGLMADLLGRIPPDPPR